jgi:hypothetical protein
MKNLIIKFLDLFFKVFALERYTFFFNKRLFLSLFSPENGDIFVGQSAMRHNQYQLMKAQSIQTTTLKKIKLLLLVACAVLLNGIFEKAYTQGWQLNYGSAKTDEGWSVLQMEDQGFLVVGFGESFGTDNDQKIFVVRTDVDGTVLWSRYYDDGFQVQARAITPTKDGNFLIIGNIKTLSGSKEDIYLLKIDRKGNQIWHTKFGTVNLAERVSDVVMDADGGFTVIGATETTDREDDALVVKFDKNGSPVWFKTYGTPKSDKGNAMIAFGNGYAFVGDSKNSIGFNNDIILFRIDSKGEIIWQSRISNSFREEGRALIATKDGGIAIAGVVNDNTDAFVVKFDANGRQIWTRSVGEAGKEEEANDIVELPDGSLAIVGLKLVDPVNVDVYIAKLDSRGNILWDVTQGDPLFTEEGRDIKATADGGFIIAGYNGKLLSSFNDMILLKTDGKGNVISNRINGRVFEDRDAQCDYDNGERLLSNWIVQAKGANNTYYGTSDAKGNYSLLVDTGVYIVSVVPANVYWGPCSTTGNTIRLKTVYDSIRVDFPVKVAIGCPYLELNVTTPFLATCSDLEYTLVCANTGTGTADKSYIDLFLDSKLAFKSASVPTQILPNGKRRIQLGSLAAGGAGKITFQASLACQGIANGQAALVSAQIYPDSSCLKPSADWDGSSIVVIGQCLKDTVAFRIQNVGKGAMKKPGRSIVVRDDVMLGLPQSELQFQLEPQQIKEIRFAANGSAYRVFADQATGHPSGAAYQTAFVEGCVNDGTPITTGTVTQFPEDDPNSNLSIDVQEIKSALLPVELRGYPKGYRDAALIDSKTDLFYTVLFKNTSTEAVQRIVIRDTLSSALDLTSIEPGASNYPYRFEVYSNGVLRITFDSIQLPAAGNAAPKYGFIKFKVAQKANTPKGTVIKNRATVFFDYQKPIASNSVKHQVGVFPDFVQVITSSKEVFVEGVSVDVYPNPFSESVTIQLKGRQYDQLQMSIYDLKGQLVRHEVYNSSFILIHRNELTAGMYVYKLESGGKLINSGKLLVR